MISKEVKREKDIDIEREREVQGRWSSRKKRNVGIFFNLNGESFTL